MKLKIRFEECEHSGDMNNYIDELPSAKVVGSELRTESESCVITVEFENEIEKDKFLKELKETDNYDFVTGIYKVIE